MAAAAGCGLDVVATGSAGGGLSPESGTPSEGSADGNVTADGSIEQTEGSVVYLPPVDGGANGPTGMPGFCAGQTSYVACWDFDDVGAGGDAGFPEVTPAGGTIDVALEGTNHVLQVTLPTTASTRNAYVRYPITSFGQLRPHYQLEMKFGVRQSTLDYDVLGALWALTPGAIYPVGVASYQSAFLDMVAPDMSVNRLTAPTGTTWHTAKITLDGPTTAMHGVVVVDGVVTLGDQTFDTNAPTQTGIDLRLGAYFTSTNNAGVTAVFDEIVVRAP